MKKTNLTLLIVAVIIVVVICSWSINENKRIMESGNDICKVIEIKIQGKMFSWANDTITELTNISNIVSECSFGYHIEDRVFCDCDFYHIIDNATKELIYSRKIEVETGL